jgi:phosphoribosylglycinamide formyltransferase-1
MVALAEACASGAVPAVIALVLSDVAEAGILEQARSRGIESRFVAPGRYRTKLDEEAEAGYIESLRQAKVDLVLLAGFMRVLKADFLSAFPGRVLNIHPSLLPSFPGLEAWRQALEYGVKVTGCTVHFVDQGIDTGPIIVQSPVMVLPNDSPATLHARIQEAERVAYPAAVNAVLRGEVRYPGHRRYAVG